MANFKRQQSLAKYNTPELHKFGKDMLGGDGLKARCKCGKIVTASYSGLHGYLKDAHLSSGK
jgi:hypothetical protein